MNKIIFCSNTKTAVIPEGWQVVLHDNHRSSKNAYVLSHNGKYLVPGVIFFSDSEPEEITPNELDAILDRCGDTWEEYKKALATGCKFEIEKLPCKEDAPDDAAAWVE